MGKKRQKKQHPLRVNRALVAAALVAGIAAGTAGAHLSASLLAIQPFEVPSSPSVEMPVTIQTPSTALPVMPVVNPYAAPAPDSLIAPAVQLPAAPAPETFTPPAPVAAPYSESIAAPQFVAPAPLEAPAPTGGFLCTFFAISCGETEVIEEPLDIARDLRPVVFDSASSSSTGGGFLCSVFGISCGDIEEPLDYARDLRPVTVPSQDAFSSEAGIQHWQQNVYDQSQFSSPAGLPTGYPPPTDEGSVSSPDALPGGTPTSVDIEILPAPAPLGLPQVAPPPAPSGLPSSHPAAQTSPPSHPVWMPREETLTISPEFSADLPWMRQSTTCGSAGVSWAIQQCPASVLVNPSPQGGPGLKIMTTVPDSLRDQQNQFLDLVRERTGRDIQVVPWTPPVVGPPETIVRPGEQFILHGAATPPCYDREDNSSPLNGADQADPACALMRERTPIAPLFESGPCFDGDDNDHDYSIDEEDSDCQGPERNQMSGFH